MCWLLSHPVEMSAGRSNQATWLPAEPPGELAMTEAPIDAVNAGGDADRYVVEHERAELRDFIKGLSADDIKSGRWFTKLSAQALSSYTDKVDWQYFQERYEGVPADAIV